MGTDLKDVDGDLDRRRTAGYGGPTSCEFASNGFVTLRNFLSCVEVEELRTLVEIAMRAPHDPACARPHNILIPLRWDDAAVQKVVLSERRMHELSESICGDDLRWVSAYISIKEGTSPPLWWHQDWWCWDHPISYQPAAAQIALLCYLTDTTVSNGALRILPGTHHKSAPIHAILPEAHSHSAETLQRDHIAMGDLAEQMTLELKAGDAVAIDYRLLHGTHANTSAKLRHCILLSFTPSWRGLPEEFRAHLIDHPAQPSTNEAPEALSIFGSLLPTFGGERRSLELNRNAPSVFTAFGRAAPITS
jgi:hypothetical protein